MIKQLRPRDDWRGTDPPPTPRAAPQVFRGLLCVGGFKAVFYIEAWIQSVTKKQNPSDRKVHFMSVYAMQLRPDACIDPHKTPALN